VPVSPAQPQQAPQPQGGVQYDYYGNPTPVYQPGQASASAGQPAGYQPAGYQEGYGNDWQVGQGRKKSPAVLILSIVLVLVVAGAAVAGIVVYNKSKSGPSSPPTPPAAGQCVLGNGGNPLLMKVVDCGAGTYLVDKVVMGTNNPQVCVGVPGVTNNYSFTWPDSQSDNYVLCLTLQK
jgi:hypothetical protein